MKRSLILWALAGLAVGATFSPPIPTTSTVPILLSWEYPTNLTDTNLIFVVHGSDVLTATSTWPVEGTVTVTNLTTLPIAGTNYVFNFTSRIQAGQHYWYFAASNFWGELSNPSTVLTIPALPVNTVNAKAQRGW